MKTTLGKFLYSPALTKVGNLLPASIKAAVKSVIRVPRRKSFAMGYYKESLRAVDIWARKYSEDTNFYYRLTPLNRLHLANLIALITGESVSKISGYFDELEFDETLRQHISAIVKVAGYGDDIEVNYGRRLGWYAFVRITKPKVTVETGVDHGVGSCILSSALLRNAEEGYPGVYFGTDINPQAGKLLTGVYASVGKILYGDSITSLRALDHQIDLFINDSDHSAEYEYLEYMTVLDKLSPSALILGDNSHVTSSLPDFSFQTHRQFVFFSEKPADHWYPGAGIGISFLKKSAAPDLPPL